MSMIGSQPTESQPTQVQPTDLGPWSLVQMFITLLGGDFFLAGLAGSVHDIDLDSLCADQQWKSIGLTSNDCSLAGGSLDCSGSFVCGDTVCNLTGPLDVTSGLVTTHDGAATLFACTDPGPDWTFTDTTGDVVSGPEGGSVLVKVDGVAVSGTVVEGQTVTVGPTTATVVAVDTPTGPVAVSGEVTVSGGSVSVGGSDPPFGWEVSTQPSEFDAVAEVVTDPAVHSQLSDFSQVWGIPEPQQAAFGLGQLTGWILNGSRTMDRLDAELEQEFTSQGFVGEEKQKARDTRQQALSLIFGASILKLQTMGTVPTTTTQPTQAPPRTGPGQTQAEEPEPARPGPGQTQAEESADGDGQQRQEGPRGPVGQTVAEEPLHPDETSLGQKLLDFGDILLSVIPGTVAVKLLLKAAKATKAVGALLKAGKGVDAARTAAEGAKDAAKLAEEAAKAARAAGATQASLHAQSKAGAAAKAAEEAAQAAESAAKAERVAQASGYSSTGLAQSAAANEAAAKARGAASKAAQRAQDAADEAIRATHDAAKAAKAQASLWTTLGGFALAVTSIDAAMRFGKNLGHRLLK